MDGHDGATSLPTQRTGSIRQTKKGHLQDRSSRSGVRAGGTDALIAGLPGRGVWFVEVELVEVGCRSVSVQVDGASRVLVWHERVTVELDERGREHRSHRPE